MGNNPIVATLPNTQIPICDLQQGIKQVILVGEPLSHCKLIISQMNRTVFFQFNTF